MPHEHKTSMVFEETYRKAIVPGVDRKKFTFPYCGGRDGCGAIYMNGRWYSNPEVEELFVEGRAARAAGAAS